MYDTLLNTIDIWDSETIGGQATISYYYYGRRTFEVGTNIDNEHILGVF